MSRKRTISPTKKIALLVGAGALVGGVVYATTGTSQASVVCDGLASALRNNQDFIAAQQAQPDAQSAARIANRQAVIAQIGVQQRASGCAGGAEAGAPAGGNAPPVMTVMPQPGQQTNPPAGAQTQDPGTGQGDTQPVGDVVCPGSTVTLSGEGGAPGASSNQFPAGTKLKVTNLDNNKSTTVSVTSPSGSCILLNNAAFEQVREPGKFLIRHARIERVG